MKAAFTTILALLCFSIYLYASEKNKDYEFIHKDNYYSFRAYFFVNADFDCLMNIVYDFEHICQYAAGAKSLEKIRQGKNWYDVTYTYQKLFLKNQSTWRRILQRDQGRVFFEMTSNKNNLNIIHETEFSSGYYQIKAINKGHMVEYFQECRLYPGLLKISYINQAKKGAIQFLKEFKDYIKKTCKAEIIQ